MKTAVFLSLVIATLHSTQIQAAECTTEELTTISDIYSAAMSEGTAACPDMTTATDMTTTDYCSLSDCLDFMSSMLDELPDCSTGGVDLKAGLQAALDYCATGTANTSGILTDTSLSSETTTDSSSSSDMATDSSSSFEMATDSSSSSESTTTASSSSSATTAASSSGTALRSGSSGTTTGSTTASSSDKATAVTAAPSKGGSSGSSSASSMGLAISSAAFAVTAFIFAASL